MATATFELRSLPTGLTITADLYPRGNDTASFSAVALTERTNSKGVYRGTCSAPTEGYYLIIVKLGTDIIYEGGVYLKNVASTFYVDDPASLAGAELSAVPSAAPDIPEMIQFLYQSVRNQATQTASAQTFSKDDGTVVATATTTDNGTTYTKGKMS